MGSLSCVCATTLGAPTNKTSVDYLREGPPRDASPRQYVNGGPGAAFGELESPNGMQPSRPVRGLI